MVRVAPHSIGVFGQDWVREQFERGLGDLNDHLLVLGSSAADPRIGPISQLDLPPGIFGFHYDLRDAPNFDGKPFSLFLHRNFPQERADLPQDVIDNTIRTLSGVPRNTGRSSEL